MTQARTEQGRKERKPRENKVRKRDNESVNQRKNVRERVRQRDST